MTRKFLRIASGRLSAISLTDSPLVLVERIAPSFRFGATFSLKSRFLISIFSTNDLDDPVALPESLPYRRRNYPTSI